MPETDRYYRVVVKQAPQVAHVRIPIWDEPMTQQERDLYLYDRIEELDAGGHINWNYDDFGVEIYSVTEED